MKIGLKGGKFGLNQLCVQDVHYIQQHKQSSLNR